MCSQCLIVMLVLHSQQAHVKWCIAYFMGMCRGVCLCVYEYVSMCVCVCVCVRVCACVVVGGRWGGRHTRHVLLQFPLLCCHNLSLFSWLSLYAPLSLSLSLSLSAFSLSSHSLSLSLSQIGRASCRARV